MTDRFGQTQPVWRLVLSMALGLAVLAGIGLLLCGGQPSALAATSAALTPFWVEDFSAFSPAAYYIEATAGSGVITVSAAPPTSGNPAFLLTQYAANQRARIFYNNLTLMDQFTASFRLNFGRYLPPTYTQAVGNGIAFALCPHYSYKPTPSNETADYERVDAECPGGYLIDFDTKGADSVYVAFENQGVRLAQADVSGWGLANAAWHTATVEFQQGNVSVYLDNTLVFANARIPGYVPFWGYFGFAADTGRWGRYISSYQLVDDIRVHVAASGGGQNETWVDDDFNSASPSWGVNATNSVTRAMWMVKPPGVVHVAPGVYPVSWDIGLIGGARYTPTLWLRPGVSLIGGGAFATTLDAQHKNVAVWANYWAMSGSDVISGFTARNGNAFDWTRHSGGGLDLWAGSEHVVNCRVQHNTGNWGGGIALVQSKVPLVNAMVIDNQAGSMGSGIFIYYSSGSVLYHSTIARNTGAEGSGVLVSNSTAWLTNTIIASQTIGVQADAGGFAKLDTTLWGRGAWANGVDASGSVDIGAVNYYADPGFVDPASGDYHLNSTSLAVDRGANVGIYYDIDDQVRPNNFVPDLGADEYYLPPLDERLLVPMVIGQ